MALLNTDVRGPLAQGDILEGLVLYHTGVDSDARTSGAEYLGLVLSRNCNATRKETVLIAEIRPYRSEVFSKIDASTIKEVGGKVDSQPPSLDLLRRRFDGLRDGVGEPDQLYLGTLPDRHNGRFAARLDAIYTIAVPTEPSAREAWINAHRIARLSNDHRRHLHARLFDAIAHEGFDDFSWWCKDDLRMVIIAGQRELRAAEGSRDECAMKIQQATDEPRKAAKGRETKLEALKDDVALKAQSLAPFRDEWKRRYGDEEVV